MRILFAVIAAAMASPVLAQETQNWAVQCVAPERAAPLACSASQTIVDSQTGQALLNFSVQDRPGQDSPVVVVQTSSDLYIPNGIDFDGVKIPVETCGGAACVASGTYAGDLEQKLQDGAPRPISYETAQRQTVGLTIITEGFSDAFDKIAVER